MIYLIGTIAVLTLLAILFFNLWRTSNKKNKELSWKLDNYSKAVEINAEIEKDKTDIRNKYNEQETNISNSSTPVDSVVPIGKVRQHNHKFSEPCGKNCPAYN